MARLSLLIAFIPERQCLCYNSHFTVHMKPGRPRWRSLPLVIGLLSKRWRLSGNCYFFICGWQQYSVSYRTEEHVEVRALFRSKARMLCAMLIFWVWSFVAVRVRNVLSILDTKMWSQGKSLWNLKHSQWEKEKKDFVHQVKGVKPKRQKHMVGWNSGQEQH